MTTWASFQQRYTQLTAELRNRRFDMSREPSRTIDGNSQQQPQSQQSQQPPLATGGTGGTGGGGGGGVGASNTNSNNNNNSSTSNSHSPSDIFNSIKNLSLNSTASSTSSSISAPSFNLTPSPVSPASSSKVPSLTPTSEKGGQQMTTTTTTTTTTTPKSENSSFARSFMTGRLSLGKGSLSTRLNQFFFSGSPESPSEKEASPSNGDHFLRATTATEIINNHCLSPRPRPRPLGLGPGSPRRPGPLGIEAMGRPFPTSDLSFVTGMPDALNTLCINGSRRKVREEEFEKIEELGSGSCGHVEKMLHKPSGEYVAVKQMRISNNSDDSRIISRDLDVLLKCSDPQIPIVQCYGYLIMNNDVWVFMELMSSCFDKILKRVKSPLPEEIIGKVAVSTVKALDYLKREKNVMHRDIKPSNILVNRRGEIKLCDFGISGRLVDSKAKTKTAGCTAYLAPERIEPQDPQDHTYDVRADVWSLGLTLVEMSKGCFPYPPCTCDFQLMTLILSTPSPQPDPNHFSKEFCDFCRSCLAKDVKTRPKYKELLKHSFIKIYEERHVEVGEWFERVMNIRSD